MRITCQAVLFDMDGTLADSTAVVEALWTRFAEATHVDAAEVIEFAHGRPSLTTIRHYASPANVDRWMTTFTEWEHQLFDDVHPIPGAVALTSTLPPGRWAVVTSALRAAAQRRLDVIGVGQPQVLIGADNVTQGKPDPEGYRTAATALGFAPQDCVVFEDVEAGLVAGVAAGATAVVVGRQRGPVADRLPRVHDLSGVRVAVTADGLEITGIGHPLGGPHHEGR